MNRRSFLGLGLKSAVLAAALTTGLGRTALELAEKLDIQITVTDYDFGFRKGVGAQFASNGAKYRQAIATDAETDEAAIDQAMPHINHWYEMVV